MKHKSKHSIRFRTGFTLIELLVTISIIALLMGILLAALSMARNHSRRSVCSSNLRQIHLATEMYLQQAKDTYYWRSSDIPTEGMDWFAYGGRETGNQYFGVQGNYFNNFVPRPLNDFTGGNLEIYRCPFDALGLYGSMSAGLSYYEWVGNTYMFNNTGHPFEPAVDPDMGLAGRRSADIQEPTKTVVYLDGIYRLSPTNWHASNGNIAFADGHVKSMALPEATDEDYSWGP